MGSEELSAVTTMRGLASLAVCWAHVALYNEHIPKSFFSFGMLGPHVFFIISGFVVPWALWRAHYNWKAAPRFLAKRLSRLDPPYFATIALILLLDYLRSAVGVEKVDFGIDWARLAVHFAYANAFAGLDWYNPVFWTLAIEFQYYLLVALIFPVLCARDWRVRLVAMVIMILAYVPFHASRVEWVFSFLPLFMIGFLLFQRAAGIIGTREFWFWSLPLIASGFAHSPLLPGLALVTVGLLLQNRFHTQVTAFLGRISYSLYLVHAPIAMLQAGTATHLETVGERVMLAFVTMGVCIVAAWIFYSVAEAPSIALAKGIRYRGGGSDRSEGVHAYAETERPAEAHGATAARD